MITLRPYQKEAKTAVKRAFKEDGITSLLVTMATGLGKTVTFVDIARHFKKILVICHREELIMQAYNKLELYFPLQVGIVKASRFEIDKKVVVASVQTLYNRIDRIQPEMFDHIIVDECHRYMAKTYIKTVRHFKPRLRIGYTATPKRLDGLDLTNLFEKHVFSRDIEFGVKERYLAKPEAYRIETLIDISKVKKARGDFKIGELSNKVNTPVRNNFIVNKYNEICNGEQVIAYCVDMKHACDLRDTFREHGHECEALVSDKEITPDRDGILNKFKKGKLQVLVNVEILTEGFDYEDVGAIINARPTMSESLYIQMTGRGLRPKSDNFKNKYNHDTCFILDFVDNCGKHSLINSSSIEKNKPLKDRIFLNTKEKEERIKGLKEKKEREARIKSITKETLKVNLLKLPDVKVFDSARMEEPATEKQLDWLKRLGVFDPKLEYTKKQASEYITHSPAAKRQINFLKARGYDTSNGVSIGQFQTIKRQIDGNATRKRRYPIPNSNRKSW